MFSSIIYIIISIFVFVRIKIHCYVCSHGAERLNRQVGGGCILGPQCSVCWLEDCGKDG